MLLIGKRKKKVREKRPGGSTTKSRPALTQFPPTWNCSVRLTNDKSRADRSSGDMLETLTWRLWPSITSPQPTRWDPVTGGKPTDWLTPISPPVELNNDLGRGWTWGLEGGTQNSFLLVSSQLPVAYSCHLPPLSTPPYHPSFPPVTQSIFHIIHSATLPLLRFRGCLFCCWWWRGKEMVMKRKESLHTLQNPLTSVYPIMCPAQQ